MDNTPPRSSDPAPARALRLAFGDLDLIEKPMFGGLCLMHRGHMIAGTFRGSAIFRVGKPNMPRACAIPGVTPMQMSPGRPMPGMVAAAEAVLADPARLQGLAGLARAFNLSQPPR